MVVDTEQGLTVMSTTVDIPPGGTRTLEITFTGTLDRRGDDDVETVEPAVLLPNLAIPPTFTLETIPGSSG